MKMKIQAFYTALLFVGSEAFAPVAPQSSRQATPTALEGQKNAWMGPAAVASAALGWTLASQAAFADVVPQAQEMQTSSFVVAVEKLDFSLPSYEGIGSNVGGFGQGTEARLTGTSSMTDPGSNEKAKQAEAMRKAEEARLARKAAEKEAKLQRNEDQIRAAEAKKKADAERVAAFFTGQ